MRFIRDLLEPIPLDAPAKAPYGANDEPSS